MNDLDVLCNFEAFSPGGLNNAMPVHIRVDNIVSYTIPSRNKESQKNMQHRSKYSCSFDGGFLHFVRHPHEVYRLVKRSGDSICE